MSFYNDSVGNIFPSSIIGFPSSEESQESQEAYFGKKHVISRIFSTIPSFLPTYNISLDDTSGLNYINDPPDNSTSGADDSPNAIAMVLLVLILMVIIVGTIVGNILVCVAVCLVRKLRRPYNYLLVSLAVSDLCVAILVMPMALLHELIGEWQFGRMACDVWVSFDVLSCTASILNLCMISVDRYLAITRPLEYGVKRTPRRMVAYVVFVWLGAAFISVPPVLILGNEHGDGSMCVVCQNFWYQIYATFGSFYIPLTVMVIVYLKIFQAAQRIVNEERKAQVHLRLVEEQGRFTVPIKPPSFKNAKDNQTGSKTSSRYSVVQLNNGEIETKLATSTLEGQWVPPVNNLFPNKTLRPLGDNNCHSSTGTQLLEVPLGGGPVSPLSTSTSCDSSWSIQPSRENKTEVVSVTLNPRFEDNKCQMSIKDSITSDKIVLPKRGSDPSTVNLLTCSENENNSNLTTATVLVNSLPNPDESSSASHQQENLLIHEITPTDLDHLPSIATFEPRNASDASSQALLGGSYKASDRRNSSLNSPRKKIVHPPKSKLRLTLAKERKASTTLGIIMSAFIICWLPFFVLAIVRPFLSHPNMIPPSVSSLFLWLGYANSLLNPIIYATLNKDFRKPFQEILCLRCSSLNLLMREEFYHSQYGPDTPTHSHGVTKCSFNATDRIDFGYPPTLTDSIKGINTTSDIISESRF